MPSPPVSVCPLVAVPVMTGRTVLVGAAGATTPVASDVAVAWPPSLRAVTATRIVAPTSAPASVYVLWVALAIAEQPPPPASQRCHW